MGIRIDAVYVSADVNTKLNGTHNLTVELVEDALAVRWGERWSQNDEGVWRILCFGRTPGGAKLKIVLYPAGEEGAWNLGSAFPVPG